jgi:hypothetical protein
MELYCFVQIHLFSRGPHSQHPFPLFQKLGFVNLFVFNLAGQSSPPVFFTLAFLFLPTSLSFPAFPWLTVMLPSIRIPGPCLSLSAAGHHSASGQHCKFRFTHHCFASHIKSAFARPTDGIDIRRFPHDRLR